MLPGRLAWLRGCATSLSFSQTAVRAGAVQWVLPLPPTRLVTFYMLRASHARPAAVLDAVPGLALVPLRSADECCGGAGIYGITHPDLGGRIGGDKVAAVVETQADVVVSGNAGCMMQIGAGLRMAKTACQVLHPVELLDESYRRAGLYRAER